MNSHGLHFTFHFTPTLSSILIVFIRISITPVNDVIIIIGLSHIIIFGVVVVMMMLIISSSVAQ